jgi:predicted Rossmann fold nucleotide-binding protein DprA/Smf involved in DNA uptake
VTQKAALAEGGFLVRSIYIGPFRPVLAQIARTLPQCAAELVRRNVVVLSGLAKGIDENAHVGAIDYFGQSIAVLGQGIAHHESGGDTVLANRILDFDGAVISEYLPKDSSSRNSFLRRNELQVALSRVVIPIESPSLESGTGATIRRALSSSAAGTIILVVSMVLLCFTARALQLSADH